MKKLIASLLALLVALGIGLGVSQPWKHSHKANTTSKTSTVNCAADKDNDCPGGEAKSESLEK